LVCRQTRLAIEESLREIEANPEKYPDRLDVEQLMAELTAAGWPANRCRSERRGAAKTNPGCKVGKLRSGQH
jgi:hypothetical protein